jgi:hypothetical protein
MSNLSDALLQSVVISTVNSYVPFHYLPSIVNWANVNSTIYQNYSESEETRPTRIIYSWEITLIEDTTLSRLSLCSLR